MESIDYECAHWVSESWYYMPADDHEKVEYAVAATTTSICAQWVDPSYIEYEKGEDNE